MVVHMWLTVDVATDAPTAIQHRLTCKVGDFPEEVSVVAATATVSNALIRIYPALRGSEWLAGNGAGNAPRASGESAFTSLSLSSVSLSEHAIRIPVRCSMLSSVVSLNARHTHRCYRGSTQARHDGRDHRRSHLGNRRQRQHLFADWASLARVIRRRVLAVRRSEAS